MISSQNLKTFVKMHEYKLNAKVNAMRADRLHDRLEHEADFDVFEGDDSAQATSGARYMHRFEQREDRRRPKSRYFNFILTAPR